MAHNTTTIQLERATLEELKKIKDYPEQSYNSLLAKMIQLFKKAKGRNQYDRFLHEIQRQKMTELWDNPEDEAWENA